jgi:hypothetical protein
MGEDLDAGAPIRLLTRELNLLRETVARQEQRIAQLEDREQRVNRANHRPLPAESEDVEVPPTGMGILKTLQGRGFIVTISCSSQYSGSTDNLLVNDTSVSSRWCSNNTPNSWIQWTFTNGVKVIIDRVIIKGQTGNVGVLHFKIEGSPNDGRTWFDIIQSDSCAPRYENYVTTARAELQNYDPVTMIRLTQTGKCVNVSGVDCNDYFVLTYFDFGGKIILPSAQ